MSAGCSPPLLPLTPEAKCPSSSSGQCTRGGPTLSRQNGPQPLLEESQAGFSSQVTGCVFQNCFRFTKNGKIAGMSQTTPSLLVLMAHLGHRQWFLANAETSSCLSPAPAPLLSRIPHPRSIRDTMLPASNMLQKSCWLSTSLVTWAILRTSLAACETTPLEFAWCFLHRRTGVGSHWEKANGTDPLFCHAQVTGDSSSV